MSSLNGKVAVVTGASKGIGSGIADALAAAETRVAANYSSDRKRADRLTQVIVKSGGKAITFGADVSKAADVVRLFDEVGTVFGRLDVLVNNAGISRFGTLAEISEESFHLHYNINVLGLIFTVQQAIERFGAEGAASSISVPLSAPALCREPCSTRPPTHHTGFKMIGPTQF
jgi:3-oxoacyl-[acyl-carrier protein] reductase